MSSSCFSYSFPICHWNVSLFYYWFIENTDIFLVVILVSSKPYKCLHLVCSFPFSVFNSPLVNINVYLCHSPFYWLYPICSMLCSLFNTFFAITKWREIFLCFPHKVLKFCFYLGFYQQRIIAITASNER